MKKFIPIILLLLGAVMAVAVYFVVFRGGPDEEMVPEEEVALVEVPFEESPYASLTPTADGHFLNLYVSNMSIMANKYESQSMDYELLYKLPDGRTQGVPGSVKLQGLSELERELLLGSESSGKFRYDEGVEEGTLSLRFRDEDGKLIAKFTTEFSLLNGVDELTMPGESFTYTLEGPQKGYFVVMNTFGVETQPDFTLISGPYGVFGSMETEVPGTVNATHSLVNGVWEEIPGGESEGIGVFVSASTQ